MTNVRYQLIPVPLTRPPSGWYNTPCELDLHMYDIAFPFHDKLNSSEPLLPLVENDYNREAPNMLETTTTAAQTRGAKENSDGRRMPAAFVPVEPDEPVMVA